MSSACAVLVMSAATSASAPKPTCVDRYIRASFGVPLFFGAKSGHYQCQLCDISVCR